MLATLTRSRRLAGAAAATMAAASGTFNVSCDSFIPSKESSIARTEDGGKLIADARQGEWHHVRMRLSRCGAAEVNAFDVHGQTILHLAARSGRRTAVGMSQSQLLMPSGMAW